MKQEGLLDFVVVQFREHQPNLADRRHVCWRQSCVIGGTSKTMKTSTDLAHSQGKTQQFLAKLWVQTATKLLLLSAKLETATTQEVARRIADVDPTLPCVTTKDFIDQPSLHCHRMDQHESANYRDGNWSTAWITAKHEESVIVFARLAKGRPDVIALETPRESAGDSVVQV